MAALNRSVIEEMLKETRVALQKSLIFSIQHSCQVCGEGRAPSETESFDMAACDTAAGFVIARESLT